MTSLPLNAVALLAFTAAFLLFAVALPTVRMLRKTGITGFVAHRPPTPVHEIAVAGFRWAALGVIAWPFAFLLFGPARLSVWDAPAWVTSLGWALASLSTVLIVVAQLQMGASWRIGIDAERKTDLVTSGLFAWVRNPIFSGVIGLVLGIVLITPSPWTVMVWVLVVHTIAVQVRLEEEHLLRLHGARYAEYAARVGRFLPAWGRLRSNEGGHGDRRARA